MNRDPIASGLARVQSESHIPANTWRQWCDRLSVEPELAIELWDDVCHPMMLASGKAPDLALILQLRAARPDIYIDDFRDELPAVLLSTTFVDALHSEERGAIRGALLRLYRYLGVHTGEPVGNIFVAHAGSLTLLEAVLPEDLTLPKLIKVLCAGKGTLEDLCRLGRRALTGSERDVAVGKALDAALVLLHPPPPLPATEPSAHDIDADDDDDDEQDDDEQDDDEQDDDEQDDDEQDDDEQDDDDDDDEPEDVAAPQRPPGPQDLYLQTLRVALAAACASESMADPAEREARLQAIAAFNPLKARIPTIEEAQRMSQRAEPSGEGRRRALESGGGRSAPRVTTAGGGGGRPSTHTPSAGGGGGSTVTIIKAGTMPAGGTSSRARSAGASGGTSGGAAGGAPTASPEAAATATDGEMVSAAANSTAPAVNAQGKVPTPKISRHELDQAVQSIADGLNRARELDERIWLLFADVEYNLEDPRALAEDLATQDSDGERAGASMCVAAQQQRVRSLLELPADRRLNGRRFDLEAEAWLNTVANYRRSYEPDARQLISVPRVLDYAASALVRIEALRAAIEAARDTEAEEEPTVAFVSRRYELLLSDITFLCNADVMAATRLRADADVEMVLAAVVADAWIERVSTAILDWVDAVVDAGACESVDTLKAAFDSTPLQLDVPGEGPSAGPFPDKLAADSALGEIVDVLRVQALQGAWGALQPQHRPQETAEKLDLDLRRKLRGQARITPRRERHQKNPRIALPMASLERLSGVAALEHLFVRLTTDGKLLFLEDYEDGSFIDVFSLRENKKRQMHARAHDRARSDHTGELQPGSSYLYTLCRTNNPFAHTERDILAACVVDDEGEPVIFDPF